MPKLRLTWDWSGSDSRRWLGSLISWSLKLVLRFMKLNRWEVGVPSTSAQLGRPMAVFWEK